MTEITDSTGNVFSDIGLPADHMAKAEVAARIHRLLCDPMITVTQGADLCGIGPIALFRIAVGRVSGYTLDQLGGFADALEKASNHG